MEKNQRIYLLLSFLGTITIFLWMRQQGAPLSVPSNTPIGILNLEFAWNQQKVEAVADAWRGQMLTVARNNIYIDFLFIIAYTTLLTLCCKWLALKHTGKWAAAGDKMARILPAAGTFDVAENALMLVSLQGVPNNYTAIITTAFAVFKFALVIGAIGYILVASAALLVKR
jgi:hypothetical protein